MPPELYDTLYLREIQDVIMEKLFNFQNRAGFGNFDILAFFLLNFAIF